MNDTTNWEEKFLDLVADQDGRDFVDSSLRISVLKHFISALLLSQKQAVEKLVEQKKFNLIRGVVNIDMESIVNLLDNILNELLKI